MTTMAHTDDREVVIGIDTHRDLHVAVALDHLGRRLGELTVRTERGGYAELVSWAEALGEVRSFGVEGTGCYGAGLTRFLEQLGHVVIEVLRPNRQTRRRKGKSDPTDAEAAARAVLSGEAAGRPKGSNGPVEAIRVLRVARSTARKARTQAVNALRALLVTAPDNLRAELKGLPAARLAERTARLRCTGDDLLADTKVALRSLARRYRALDQEIEALDTRLDRLVASVAPELLECFAVATDNAGALLVAAGDHPERMHSEAAFSMLCGASPLDASSGLQQRHRLNRGGDRQANAALYRIAIVRMRWHEPTKEYVARRLQEGKTKAEIIRCLKRYIAREVYGVLKLIGEERLQLAA